MVSHSGEPWSDDESERLVGMYVAGTKPREMAEALGRGRAAVSAQRLKLQREGRCPITTKTTRPRRHQPWTEKDLCIARKMLAEGSDIRSIARVLNRVQGEVASQSYALRAEAQADAGRI